MAAARVSVELTEWQTLEPTPGSALDGVFFADTAARSAASQLTQSGLLGLDELRTGLRVHATSYVGRVLLGDVQVTVRPKIEQVRLLRLLRYAYGLRDLRLFQLVRYDAAADAFPEILIRQLAAEAQELLTRGLRRAYVRADDELASPRGRIDLGRLARNGGIVRAALPCTHHPRSEDTLPNQVLLAGLRLAAQITSDSALRLTLHRLAAAMDEGVSVRHLDGAVLDRVDRAMTRSTTAYEPALVLIRMLLVGEGITLETGGAHIRVPGFLFDMNRFFQAVLSRFLRENLVGFTVRDEYWLRGMLAYHPQHDPWKHRAPTPRPDYAVLHGTTVVALLDAKYMDLWDRQAIGQDVLYQLAIYALSQPLEATATILYPTTDPTARDARVDISDPVHGGPRAHVVARPVNLDRLEACIAEVPEVLGARKRAAYARALVFEGAER